MSQGMIQAHNSELSRINAVQKREFEQLKKTNEDQKEKLEQLKRMNEDEKEKFEQLKKVNAVQKRKFKEFVKEKKQKLLSLANYMEAVKRAKKMNKSLNGQISKLQNELRKKRSTPERAEKGQNTNLEQINEDQKKQFDQFVIENEEKLRGFELQLVEIFHRLDHES
jgi:predicted small secreted protein